MITLCEINGDIYMPSTFVESLAHGRTSYDISIYSKTEAGDFRFFILFDYHNRPLVSVRDNSNDPYQKIINTDNLVAFIEEIDSHLPNGSNPN